MGSCISKCSLRPSSAIHPNPPQEKLNISHSNSAAIVSSSTSFTLESRKSKSLSSSSSSSSSKTEQNSSESISFPAKKNQHVITLDTHIPNTPIPRPKPPPQTAVKTTQLSAKRGRPSSPKPFVQKKIMRREAPILRRESNSRPWADPPLAAIDYRKEKAILSGDLRRLEKSRVMRRVRFVHPEQSNGGRMEGIDNPLISMECFIFL